MDQKDKDIQRLQNQVNALTHQLIGVYRILQEDVFKGENDGFFESKINALKSLLKTPGNRG